MVNTRDQSKITTSRGSKYIFKNIPLILNLDTLPSSSVKIRGKSSLHFRKKSFTVKLDKKINIGTTDEKYKLKSFYLLSLSMDKNYIDNHIAFSILNDLGLYGPAFTYCDLSLNNEMQGIYLIMERPVIMFLKR
jgi:spore coat protein H